MPLATPMADRRPHQAPKSLLERLDPGATDEPGGRHDLAEAGLDLVGHLGVLRGEVDEGDLGAGNG